LFWVLSFVSSFFSSSFSSFSSFTSFCSINISFFASSFISGLISVSKFDDLISDSILVSNFCSFDSCNFSKVNDSISF